MMFYVPQVQKMVTESFIIEPTSDMYFTMVVINPLEKKLANWQTAAIGILFLSV